MNPRPDPAEITHAPALHVAGYVPPAPGADGQEDPAPEPVVDSVATQEKGIAAEKSGQEGAVDSTLPGSSRDISHHRNDDDGGSIAEKIDPDAHSTGVKKTGRACNPIDTPASGGTDPVSVQGTRNLAP